MVKLSVIVVCVGSWLILPQTWVGGPQEEAGAQLEQPPTSASSDTVMVLWPDGRREEAPTCPAGFTETTGENGRRFCIDPTKPMPEALVLLGQPAVAGIPYEEASAIVERHRQELMQLPGVDAVVLGRDALLIWTTNPSIVPSQVEGLPIQALLSHNKLDCGPGARIDTETGRCLRMSPSSNPPAFQPLPPPPGVIILRPGGIREQAESCPAGFQETVSYGWRFCIDPNHPEAIPALMTPPIAGIPYEEAREILERHKMELFQFPGVHAVGLGVEGIRVETEHPEALPQAVEGLPVHGVPYEGPGVDLSHSSTTEIRPLLGALSIRDALLPRTSWGTSSAAALSQGKLWLIFPAHLIKWCTNPSFCKPTTQGGSSVLNTCPHYDNTRVMLQPPDSSDFKPVSYIQRWDHSGTEITDVAAAYMDSNSTEGDGSVAVRRELSIWGPFSGLEADAVLGSPVTIVSSVSPHVLQATVSGVDQRIEGLLSNCSGSVPDVVTNRDHQTLFTVTGSLSLAPGDSGALVLDQFGKVVGMANWRRLDNPWNGGGTNATTIRQVLGFDKWYGTDSVNDQTIGTFRPSTATWVMDNGNGKSDGSCTTAPTATQDGCFVYGAAGSLNGVPRSIPLTGDWDNDVNKTVTVGVYRTDINPERFELRNSNSAGPPQIILNAGTQPTGYQPVAGKWAGSNSVTKVGVLALDGAWYLDNGNFVVDGCPPDTCFNTSAWTQPGDKPLAGDWDGNGIVTIGVFRPSTGKFYLSNQMPPTGVDVTISAGSYRPVVGNWTGLGGTKLGVYNQGTGGWYLVNGLVPTTCATDFCYPAGSLGIAEDLPVSFGLSVIRAN